MARSNWRRLDTLKPRSPPRTNWKLAHVAEGSIFDVLTGLVLHRVNSQIAEYAALLS